MQKKRNKLFILALALMMVMTMIPAGAYAAVTTADVTDGLVTKLEFDGNTNDTAGIGVQYEYGITYDDGIFGQAAVFNGKSSILETKYSNKLYNDKFSFSVWVYMGDCEGEYQPIAKLGSERNEDDQCFRCCPWNVFSDVGNDVAVEFNDSDSEYIFWRAGTYNSSKWQLLTTTYDGTYVKQYRNGKLTGSERYTDGLCLFNKYGLFIGYDEVYGESRYYNGKMDDLRVYNRPLSESEVATLYKRGVESNKEALEPAKKMVSHFAFENSIDDNKGNKGEVAEGEVEYASGVVGKALSLDGESYIEVPWTEAFNMNDRGSISFWAKADKDDQQSYVVLSLGNPATTYANCSNSDSDCYKITIVPFGNQIAFWEESHNVYNNGTTYFESVDKYWSDNNNMWHFYTVVYDTIKDKLRATVYVDGNAGKRTLDEYWAVANGGELSTLRIGTANPEGYGEKFDGKIDELKFYNYALTAAEVEKEYKATAKLALTSADAKKVASIAKGKSVTIKKVNLKNGAATTALKSSLKDVKFKSSNKKIFTVTSSGKIVAKKKGTATLTVSYGKITKKYTVKVK